MIPPSHQPTKAFRDLCSQIQESSQSIPPLTAMGYIAGVFCDIKPVAFCDFTEQDLVIFDPKSFRANLETLGIFVEFEPIDYAGHPGLRWYISKDPAKIARLKTIESQYSFDDDVVRKTGQLLGYPETATEYFLRRLRMENPPDPDINPDYPISDYIHDPAHLEEEYAAYERPILECLARHCPEIL